VPGVATSGSPLASNDVRLPAPVDRLAAAVAGRSCPPESAANTPGYGSAGPETLGKDLADHGRRPQREGELQLQWAHAKHGVVDPFERLGIELGRSAASLTRIEPALAAIAL